MTEKQPSRIEVPTDWAAYARERAAEAPRDSTEPTLVEAPVESGTPVVEASYDQDAAIEDARRQLQFIGGDDPEEMKLLRPAYPVKLIAESTPEAPNRPAYVADDIETPKRFQVIQGVQDTLPKKRSFWNR